MMHIEKMLKLYNMYVVHIVNKIYGISNI